MATLGFADIVAFIKEIYPNENPVPLHAPRFLGEEKKNLAECIDTTYVSYVGRFVTKFEDQVKELTGARNAVAIVNGTAALHMAFVAAGVKPGDEVVTQSLTFAGTAAGIRHAGAEPAFVDVDLDTMGMSPDSLFRFLSVECDRRAEGLYDRANGRKIAAVVPMHSFGHPVRIVRIREICDEFGIQLIEDAAESIGSSYRGAQTGTFGRAAILSFNGNKTVTAGGGGMVVTDDDALAERVRHLSTTAKLKHPWEFVHDEAGYNLRLTNVNAAIGSAQMDCLDLFLANKRKTASSYAAFFEGSGYQFFLEPPDCVSNYWLNCLVMKDRTEREAFLEHSNTSGVQTRPIWRVMNTLKPYEQCHRTALPNAEWLVDRVVNLPSSVRPWR